MPNRITDSETFCPHAWLGATHTNGGFYKPCCRFTRMTHDNTWKLSPEENKQKLNQIREGMIKGNHPAHCLNCWREEDKGSDSLRTLALKQEWWHPYKDRINQTAEDGSTDVDPIYYDLKLGNKCNLACVMCHAGDSSLIEQELRDHPDLITEKEQQELNWLETHKVTDEDINKLFNRIENVSDLLTIKFTGGEPFVNPRIGDFLDSCIERGINKDITLMFTSNLIALNQKIINRLEQFPKAHVSVSMEGVDTIYEYMRYPATWKKFESNWKRLKETEIPRDIVFSICGLNIKYMPWWMAWAKDEKANWMPNIVWNPIHLSLPEMPMHLKQVTMENLRDAQDQWPEDKKLLESLILTMMQPTRTQDKAWDKTIAHLDRLDKIRNRKVEDFLPGMLPHLT